MRIWLVSVLCWCLGAVGAAAQVAIGLNPAPPERYAAIPDAYQPFSGQALPQSVDLSDRFPPPGDQDPQQSCVGWAVAYAMKSYQEATERGWSLTTVDGRAHPARVFSPSFIYNQINGGTDQGSNFGDAFRVLITQGAAPLAEMPYTPSPFIPPSAAARAAAADFRIDTFRTVNLRNRNELRAQLHAGFPIVFAAFVDQLFWEWRGPRVIDQFGGPRLGRHAMVVVGYDDNRGAYRVINSWGRQWGDGGYAWVAYDQFEAMGTEAYIVFDQKGYDAASEPVELPADVWTPPSIPAGNSFLEVDGVDPNWMDPYLGVGLRLTGSLRIPPSVRGRAQVVITLNFASSNLPVRSLDPRYSTPDGQAAFGTPAVMVSDEGLSTRWYAFIRYCSMEVPMGTLCVPFPSGQIMHTDLLARPVLYLDGFGVAEGQTLPFWVRL